MIITTTLVILLLQLRIFGGFNPLLRFCRKFAEDWLFGRGQLADACPEMYWCRVGSFWCQLVWLVFILIIVE